MSNTTRANRAGSRPALWLGCLLTMACGQQGFADTSDTPGPLLPALGVADTGHSLRHPAAPPGVAAGRTRGALTVTRSGSASYRIPLWTPPGVGRVRPDIGLVYDSRGGNGPLGVGWSVDGLSQIARCNRSWAQDGEPAAVGNARGDRFCLDGQPLKLTSAPGSHGQPGSTYATEIERFARIVANGASGEGPASFTVTTRNGLVYEYGGAPDARVHAGGTATVRSWALSRIRDRAGGATGGNSLRLRYANDAAQGAYTQGSQRLLAIDYPITATGLGPFYTLEFEYGARPAADIPSGYLAGHPVREPNRLERIVVREAGGNLLRSTYLGYEQGTATAASRLNLVQECSATHCLAPTRVRYQEGVRGWFGYATQVGPVASNAAGVAPLPVDLDGDGLTDLLYPVKSTTSSTRWWAVLGTVGGFGAPIDTGVVTANASRVLAGRFAGTEANQVLVVLNGQWHLLSLQSGSFVLAGMGFAPAGEFQALDYDGDGLDDLASLEGPTVSVRRNLTQPPGPVRFAASGPAVWEADELDSLRLVSGSATLTSAADFDADGRADLAIGAHRATPNGTEVWWNVLRSRGFEANAELTALRAGYSVSNAPLPGDWNGDGCTDLISGLKVFVSTCAGGFAEVAVTTVPQGAATLAADWDGDGRTDLLYANPADNLWTVQRSTGTSVEAPVATVVTASPSSAWFVGDADGDGLADLGLRDAADSHRLKFFDHVGVTADLATVFTDGYGQSDSISYQLLNRGPHQRLATARFPLVDHSGSLPIVERVESTSGTGSTFTQSYTYVGARRHVQGRGFAGFESRRTTDSRNGLVQVLDMAQEYPHTGFVLREQWLQSDAATPIRDWQAQVESRTFGEGIEARRLPLIVGTTQVDYEVGGALNGQPLTESVRSLSYADDFGLPTRVAEVVTDRDPGSPFAGLSWSSSTEIAYVNDSGPSWCLGLPSAITRQGGAPGQPDRVQRSTLQVDAQACRVTQVVTQPDAPALRVSASLAYDECGNLAALNLQGANPDGTPMPVRSRQADYGERCQSPVTVRDALNQATTIEYSASLGLPTRLTDPNGLVTTWQYDDLGRLSRLGRPDGTASTLDLASCAGGPCWGGADLRVLVTRTELANDGTPTRAARLAFDGRDRLRIASSQGPFGDWHVERWLAYDTLGRVTREQQPFVSMPGAYRSHSHDLIGRPVGLNLYRATGELDRRATVAYAGRHTQHTDPLGRVRGEVHDVRGLLRRVIDPSPGGTTEYDYDADGMPVRIVDPLGAVAAVAYDDNGQRTRWTDSDIGEWRFSANSLGELMNWSDGNGKSFSVTRDALGRLLTRTDPEGVSTFSWGSSPAARNVGRSVGRSGFGLTETLAYDAVGRLASHSIKTDQTYRFDYDYDAQGLLHTVSYPDSPVPTGQAAKRLRVQYDYGHGRPIQLRDVTEGTPRVLWSLGGVDEALQPTAESLAEARIGVRSTYSPLSGELLNRRSGVGAEGDRQDLAYDWNAGGELLERRDEMTGHAESFEHDALGRIVSARLDGVQTLSLGYDASSNLRQRNGVAFQYGDPSRPHRLTKVGSKSVVHDGNGNATSWLGATQVWTSYGLPSTLRAAARNSKFYYGPQREPWKQVASYSNGTETTHYVGGLLEKVKSNTSTVSYWRHYVPTPGGQTVVVSRSSAGSAATSYVLDDHLGSGDVVLDEAGGVRARMSFDAPGSRRGSDWSTSIAPELAGIANLTRRGYTGHQSVDNLGFVHMGGRVYDPAVGRFLSADPLIGNLADSQTLNPYAYVGNRPLEYTDPTGFEGVERYQPGIREWTEQLADGAFRFGGGSGGGGSGGGRPASSLQGISAQTAAGACGAGHYSASCFGAGDFAGLLPLELQSSVAASVSSADLERAADAVSSWWQSESTVPFCGRLCAVAWNGDAGGLFAMSSSTMSNGDRVELALTLVTLPWPNLAAGRLLTGRAATTALGVRATATAYHEAATGTVTVQRWMSNAELFATQKSGLLRGGRSGTHYVTDAANADPLGARKRLALPRTPEVRVTMEVPKDALSAPSRVNPAFNMPGGGMERTAIGDVPVQIIKVD